MGNASELLINVVNFEVSKQLIGIDQTVCGRMSLFIVEHVVKVATGGETGPPSRVTVKERCKPVSLHSRQANRKERCRRCGYGMVEKAKVWL